MLLAQPLRRWRRSWRRIHRRPGDPGRDRRDPASRYPAGDAQHLLRRHRQHRLLRVLLAGPRAAQRSARRQRQLAWRWTYVILAVPALLVVFFRRYLPESPRFLLSKGRIEAANQELDAAGQRQHQGARANPGITKQFVTEADIPVPGEEQLRQRVQGREPQAHHRHWRGLVDVLRGSGHPAVPDADPAGLPRLLAVGFAGLHDDHEHRLAVRCLRGVLPGGQGTHGG